MRRIGMPLAPILCMFTCLQKLRHFVRTVYGDSSRSFSGDLWAVPLHGVGQGNGVAPAIWAVVSTPLLNIVCTNGFGVVFQAALLHNTLHFAGYTFVDDTDLCHTQPHLTSIPTLVHQAQEFVDLWEAALWSTGGALVHKKATGPLSTILGTTDVGNIIARPTVSIILPFKTTTVTGRSSDGFFPMKLSVF